jgi:hypothetical protein
MPINGHAHASKQRETRQPTFVSRHDERCPDCEFHGRLDTSGRPVPRHSQPLRPVSGRIPYGVTMCFGCETCDGTGRVKARRARKGCKSNDPMEIPH